MSYEFTVHGLKFLHIRSSSPTGSFFVKHVHKKKSFESESRKETLGSVGIHQLVSVIASGATVIAFNATRAGFLLLD